jgi:hypothetical protein
VRHRAAPHISIANRGFRRLQCTHGAVDSLFSFSSKAIRCNGKKREGEQHIKQISEGFKRALSRYSSSCTTLWFQGKKDMMLCKKEDNRERDGFYTYLPE